MSRGLQRPLIKTIQASAAQTTTFSTSAFSIGMADAYTFLVSVTAASGTSPTLDIVYQTSIDGGTTFVDIPWRHTQITAAATEFITTRLGLGVGEVQAEGAAADTGGTLAKPVVIDPYNMKIKCTIGGTSPSFTFSITLFAIGNGTSSMLT